MTEGLEVVRGGTPPGELEQIETIYGTFVTLPGDLLSRVLQRHSAHDRNEVAMLCSLLRPSDVVLDIGAHIGTYAIPIAKSQPGVRVFAFEPQPDIYALLQRNVALNDLGAQITCRCGVVSDRVQSFQRVVREGNTAGCSFVPTVEPGASDSEQPQVFIVDAMVRAGSLPGHIDLLKIDTEGAELSVLRSCAELIGRELPVLYVEINPRRLGEFNTSSSDIDRFLQSYGYRYFRNVAERVSASDSCRVARISTLAEEPGERFFDVLAIHPDDPRYPPRADPSSASISQ